MTVTENVRSHRPRVLYFLPGLVPPSGVPESSRYFHLSKVASGDVLLPVWDGTAGAVEQRLGEGSFCEYREGDFLFHFCPCPTHLSTLQQVLRRWWFYIREGLTICRDGESALPVIVSYGTGVTGLAALYVAKRTGAKLVIEVPGVPKSMNSFDSSTYSWRLRARQHLYEMVFKFVLERADHAKLLYPSQLDGFPSLRRLPRTVFHNLVPAGMIGPGRAPEEPYILFVGTPWFRKGVDILVRAFRMISGEFPSYRLKLVGDLSDAHLPRALAAGDDRIQFIPPVPRQETFSLMGSASVFVLPSRSEAMGRVLLEAMAAGRPVVASEVDGIPHYLRDGFNGLLFRSGDPHDLAEKLRLLLGDDELAERLGRNARNNLESRLNEDAHVKGFARMLEDVLEGPTHPRTSLSDATSYD